MVCPESLLGGDDTEGLTEQGGGHWRCAAKYDEAACLYKWGDGDGTGRVFILTDLDEIQTGKKYECLFLGDVSAEHDHIINMLRAATLLKQSQFDTDKEALLKAIHALNEKCEESLIHLAECRNIRACTEADVRAKCSYVAYCEDERLSIKNAGEVFKALYLPKDTPVMASDRLDELLRIMAMYINWADVKPKKSGEAKRAWDKIDQASPAP